MTTIKTFINMDFLATSTDRRYNQRKQIPSNHTNRLVFEEWVFCCTFSMTINVRKDISKCFSEHCFHKESITCNRYSTSIWWRHFLEHAARPGQATLYFLSRKMSLLLNEHQQLLPTLSQMTACGGFMMKERPAHASSACVTTDLCVPSPPSLRQPARHSWEKWLSELERENSI